MLKNLDVLFLFETLWFDLLFLIRKKRAWGKTWGAGQISLTSFCFGKFMLPHQILWPLHKLVLFATIRKRKKKLEKKEKLGPIPYNLEIYPPCFGSRYFSNIFLNSFDLTTSYLSSSEQLGLASFLWRLGKISWLKNRRTFYRRAGWGWRANYLR